MLQGYGIFIERPTHITEIRQPGDFLEGIDGIITESHRNNQVN